MRKLLIIGVSAITALAVQVAVAAGTSCIVSGSIERLAQVVTTKASNSGLNTFASQEVRLDGLNLRSDARAGLTIVIK